MTGTKAPRKISPHNEPQQTNPWMRLCAPTMRNVVRTRKCNSVPLFCGFFFPEVHYSKKALRKHETFDVVPISDDFSYQYFISSFFYFLLRQN